MALVCFHAAVQGLLLSGAYGPHVQRRTSAVQMSDGWMFVDVRGNSGESSRELEAIVDPFGRKLLVGDEQWHRVASPEALLTLDVAARNGSLLVLIPSSSCAGADAAVVQVTEVDAPSAKLISVGRCVVEGIAGKQPRLRVRVRAKPDTTLSGAALERARDAASATEGLWERALQLSQRVQQLQLKAKLRSLGSSASGALLSIPLEQQLELSRSARSDDARPPPRSSGVVEAGLDEALSTGVSLAALVRDALLKQPQDALALVPAVAGALDADAASLSATQMSSAQLSLFSFVALRLTRTSGTEAVDEYLDEQPDPRAPTIRQAEGLDALSRLTLCETRLESYVSATQAKASLLALMEPAEAEDESEDDDEAGRGEAW